MKGKLIVFEGTDGSGKATQTRMMGRRLEREGVKYREVPAGRLLRHNLLVYGLGGVVIPFIAIKLIDLLVAPLLGAL